MEAIIAMRGAIVEKGKIHPNVKTALESTFRQGNPLKLPREDRGLWADGLNLKAYAETPAEYLFYAGCTPSYDPRGQKVARALVQLLQSAGVDFGILGNDENCCASETRRLGEAGLFEAMVEENTETFKELNVQKMIAVSPHCFNAFKNDYHAVEPGEKFDAQVQHYTQALAGLAKEDRLKFNGSFAKKVTYHDPCYLGKHNGIFDEPREVLNHVPGVELIEMDRSREKSLCCEGGGGRMWLEGTNPATRLAQFRVQEAIEIGAEVLATACPFCLLTLDEAVKHLNAEEKILVLDIAEIASQALF